jgi:hypothetical protein
VECLRTGTAPVSEGLQKRGVIACATTTLSKEGETHVIVHSIEQSNATSEIAGCNDRGKRGDRHGGIGYRGGTA